MPRSPGGRHSDTSLLPTWQANTTGSLAAHSDCCSDGACAAGAAVAAVTHGAARPTKAAMARLDTQGFLDACKARSTVVQSVQPAIDGAGDPLEVVKIGKRIDC